MVDTTGITNDPKTWLVDWSQPIEWDDGTPAEKIGRVHQGQVDIKMDPLNLPKGMLQSAVRMMLVRHASEAEGASYEPYTNVIAAYGTPLHGGCRARIVNSHHRIEREAMEASDMWATF